MIKNAAVAQAAIAALQTFLSRDPLDTRKYTKASFSNELFAYGSDGLSLIQVPLSLLDEYSKLTSSPGNTPVNIAQIRDKIGKALLFGGALIEPPPLPAAIPCPNCAGSGNMSAGSACEECDGEGEFKHGRHWYDCKECDGMGTAEIPHNGGPAMHYPCSACQGRGETLSNPVPVGAAHIDRVFLARIAALPNARIATPMDATSTVYFTSDFGDGAVIPTLATPHPPLG